MANLILNNERQERIISFLKTNDLMRIKELANLLNVSIVTVRRDLEYLESQNCIIKYHGRVRLIKPGDNQSRFDMRLAIHFAEKDAIAKAAASFVEPRNIIGIDSGSTTSLIANHLPIDSSLKVITCCLISALRFAEIAGVQVVQAGGIINPETSSAIDYLATEFLNKFHTDIVFITSTTFNLPYGAFDAAISLIEAKRMLLANTKKVVYLVDHSKFNRQSMCLSVPLEKINIIVTDEKAPRETIGHLAEMGKEILIVDTQSREIIERLNKA